MPTEIIIDTQKNLDEILGELGQVLIRLNRYQRDNDSKNLKMVKNNLGALKKSLEKSLNISSQVLKDIFTLCPQSKGVDPHADKRVRAQELFRKEKAPFVEPVFGKGKLGNAFYSAGLIVGVQIEFKPFFLFSYRVDYDPVKGLHINLDVMLGETVYKFALKVRPKSNFYFVKKPNEKDAEEKQQALMALKFFSKMSLYYRLEHGCGKHENNNKDPHENIILFIKGDNFNVPVVVKALKDSYVACGYGNSENLFRGCQNIDMMLSIILNHEKIRAVAVQCIIDAYKKKMTIPELDVDSEKIPLLDSEESPAENRL